MQLSNPPAQILHQLGHISSSTSVWWVKIIIPIYRGMKLCQQTELKWYLSVCLGPKRSYILFDCLFTWVMASTLISKAFTHFRIYKYKKKNCFSFCFICFFRSPTNVLSATHFIPTTQSTTETATGLRMSSTSWTLLKQRRPGGSRSMVSVAVGQDTETWLVDCSTDQPGGQSICHSVGNLVSPLISWLFYCLITRSIGRSVGWWRYGTGVFPPLQD